MPEVPLGPDFAVSHVPRLKASGGLRARLGVPGLLPRAHHVVPLVSVTKKASAGCTDQVVQEASLNKVLRLLI